MNGILKITSILAAMMLLMTGCLDTDRNKPATTHEGTQTFDMEMARKAIDQANFEFIEAFNRSDSVGLANMFTLDAKSMEPNEPSHVGRSNIQKHYSDVMNAGANKLGLTTTGLWGDEKMLIEEGEFTFTSEDGKELDKGKYIVLWKQEEGKWKLFRDCFNSDLPVASAK